MHKNLGTADRAIRLIVGVALLGLFLLDGNLRWLGLIAIIPLGTAAIGFCPLYIPFKINTRSRTAAPQA